jgi:hypothetical protein
MTRASHDILDSGDTFPSMTMDTIAHGAVALPDFWQGGWGVLLAYRAHW